ncbi:MAG: 4'-phosphopantetheinyl transferase superfamily protein [Ferruginibacter sp.]
MPLIYQHQINGSTKIGVWHIAEEESFFLKKVPLQRSITHPHKRLQHLAGRYLLPELEPGFPSELIKIADTKKPFLENEAFHFSISHCADYAAVIISSHQRVGIDVEMVSEKIITIIPKFLTAEEMFLLLPGNIANTATLFWSVKESIYKWFGNGSVDFKKHIRIENLEKKDGSLIVSCSFLKENNIALQVHALFLNDHYLSWVTTDIH